MKIQYEFQEVYKTHNFDFSMPIRTQQFIDYKCKTCGIILFENNKYPIEYIICEGPAIHEILKYKDLTCNQILMENVLK